MEKNICYKNHHKIVQVHKYLVSPSGKKEFNNTIQYFKNNKEITMLAINMYWDEAQQLLDIIKTMCLNINDKKMSNKSLQEYCLNLHKVLDKVHTKEDLYTFINKLFNNKSLYDRTVQFYELLSDKSECVKLFH